jgi:hypothetical protein
MCDNLAPQHSKNHIQMVRDGILPKIFAVLRSPMKSIKHKHYASVVLSEVCAPLDNHRQVSTHPPPQSHSPSTLPLPRTLKRPPDMRGRRLERHGRTLQPLLGRRARVRHQPPALPPLFFCNVLSVSQLLPSSASAKTPRCAGDKCNENLVSKKAAI